LASSLSCSLPQGGNSTRTCDAILAAREGILYRHFSTELGHMRDFQSTGELAVSGDMCLFGAALCSAEVQVYLISNPIVRQENSEKNSNRPESHTPAQPQRL
jgi:hypothetical protein